RFSDELSAFAGVHRGFSVPGPRANAKDGLSEETSLGSEVGLRYRGKGMRAETVFFYTDFDDLLVADNVAGGGVEGVTENAGDIISSGVEFSAAYDLGIANNWGFLNPYHIAFTYTNATLDGDANSLDPESIFAGGRDGAKVPYIPQIQFSVGTGIEFARWGVSVDATYADETFTTASNTPDSIDPNTGKPNANFGKTDAYFVIDVSGKYNITDGISAVINLHNITDEAYIVSRHPIGPRPGKPFSASLGIETRF
ncbi:MAG: TonB-dependent receptor, partial [Candidatus Poribacteria bacterium]|nr:TonB-dependent receptor [Candidatus Poribacteria bacterium]